MDEMELEAIQAQMEAEEERRSEAGIVRRVLGAAGMTAEGALVGLLTALKHQHMRAATMPEMGLMSEPSGMSAMLTALHRELAVNQDFAEKHLDAEPADDEESRFVDAMICQERAEMQDTLVEMVEGVWQQAENDVEAEREEREMMQEIERQEIGEDEERPRMRIAG